MRYNPIDASITRTADPWNMRWRWETRTPNRLIGFTSTYLGAVVEARRSLRWENQWGAGRNRTEAL